MNIYIKSLAAGVAGAIGAYLLNILLDYNESANATYWAIIFVAITVGSFIGFKISNNRKKKD